MFCTWDAAKNTNEGAFISPILRRHTCIVDSRNLTGAGGNINRRLILHHFHIVRLQLQRAVLSVSGGFICVCERGRTYCIYPWGLGRSGFLHMF